MTQSHSPSLAETPNNCPNCGQLMSSEKTAIERLDDLPLQVKYIRQKGLMPLLPFSPATLWRRVGDGTFPKPVKISKGVTGWIVQEVRAWLEANRSTGRDAC